MMTASIFEGKEHRKVIVNCGVSVSAHLVPKTTKGMVVFSAKEISERAVKTLTKFSCHFGGNVWQ